MRTRNLARNNDLIFAQSRFERQFRGLQRGKNHALVDYFFGSFTQVAVGVFLHLAHHELLIQRTAIHADAHGLVVIARHFADGGKLLVTALAVADVAWIYAVFVERGGAIGIFLQQYVAVVMKITDQGYLAARVEQALFDFGDRGSGFRDIHRDAYKFRASLRQFKTLLRGRGDINGVRIGHGLHDHRRASADLNLADFDPYSFVAFLRHLLSIVAK